VSKSISRTFGTCILIIGLGSSASAQDAEIDQAVYEYVDIFVQDLSDSRKSEAMNRVVPTQVGPRGHLVPADPVEAVNSLLGCEPYDRKYAKYGFPLLIVKFRCKTISYSVFVRPSRHAGRTKIEVAQFTQIPHDEQMNNINKQAKG
jgi:hypothetical protein